MVKKNQISVKGKLVGSIVFLEQSAESKNLFSKGYGNSDNYSISLIEATFLVSKDLLSIIDWRSKPLSYDDLIKRASAYDKNFITRLTVFSDLRRKGYVVKTALKYGADFRIYDKGSLPGSKHAKWVCFCFKETKSFSWKEFSAINRVAHSTRKRVLIAVVDDELDVSYWDVDWVRP